jgi:type 2A phosphatase activator TIP41
MFYLFARSSLEGINNVVKPFDWTYTNDYRGSLYYNLDSQQITIEETDDKIELEKLKEHEKIFFYDDVTLFEDELADNGCAVMNVKVRVMASGFFILLRFFLRVDGVLARLHETRIYHQAGSESMLREFTKREGSFAEMKVPHSALTDPSKLSSYLKLNEIFTDKLVFPTNDE